MASFFSFPNPVDEHAARTVAAGVVLLSLLTFFTNIEVGAIVLTLGFAARVATGPKLSPLGLFATKVIAPRFSAPVLTPGPPKRFAQAIGLAFSLGVVLTWAFASWGAARWILRPLALAAFLESAFGLCLGCKGFALLMRVGLIPASVCEECGDLSKRYPSLRS
jgi:hypothetical protein